MLFSGVTSFWFWFICLLVQKFIIRRSQSNQIRGKLFSILQINWRKWKTTCRILDKNIYLTHQASMDGQVWQNALYKSEFYLGKVGYVSMFLAEPCEWRTKPTTCLLSNIGVTIRALRTEPTGRWRLDDSWLLKKLFIFILLIWVLLETIVKVDKF